ncbi:hypothetical protein [Thalassiella azotivora]
MSEETTATGPRWRRCEGKCRRVLSAEAFDGDSNVCRDCGAVAERAASAPTAAPRTRTATRRVAPTGVTGRGDREVRARRARLRALEQLATEHPEEFERYLAATREAEGL